MKAIVKEEYGLPEDVLELKDVEIHQHVLETQITKMPRISINNQQVIKTKRIDMTKGERNGKDYCRL